ncbi:uncharacterized protein CLUP02_10825 [Colletotrichum lupini]|uniref:Uncharacterized protein n=1 Tax=Colletotrichum lupini TaxID=145971 RepID=A0A9Q8WIX5_9PEZI|nr:uncharacterized protein CLUP02_10825 [Colletotrichum lupini]UQC85328.1 hypothetical protein CLUP02_10825 [Colletotrichum lupini]
MSATAKGNKLASGVVFALPIEWKPFQSNKDDIILGVMGRDVAPRDTVLPIHQLKKGGVPHCETILWISSSKANKLNAKFQWTAIPLQPLSLKCLLSDRDKSIPLTAKISHGLPLWPVLVRSPPNEAFQRRSCHVSDESGDSDSARVKSALRLDRSCNFANQWMYFAGANNPATTTRFLCLLLLPVESDPCAGNSSLLPACLIDGVYVQNTDNNDIGPEKKDPTGLRNQMKCKPPQIRMWSLMTVTPRICDATVPYSGKHQQLANIVSEPRKGSHSHQPVFDPTQG